MRKTTGLLAKLEAGGFTERQLAEDAAEFYADRALAALIAHTVPNMRRAFQPDDNVMDYRRPAYMDLVNSLAPHIAHWRAKPALVKQEKRGNEPSYIYEVPYNIAGLTHRPCFVSLAVSLPSGGGWTPSQADTYPQPSAPRCPVYWLDGRIPVPRSPWAFHYGERSMYDTLVSRWEMKA